MKYTAPFKAEGWQIPAWRDKSRICLLTGSAGGGKSRLAAEKVNGFCKKYPGATGVMLRKTRSSMTNSTVLMFDRRIVANDPHVRHMPSKQRFEYANGSILAYGGMSDEDQREQVRSIGVDGGVGIIWMEEANAFDEEDINELMPRLRSPASPWRQIILSTNPDAPTHWIYRRMIVGGEASVYHSAAHDNRHNPDDYQTTLNTLTGVQYDRLVRGLWVMAEGVIYDVWSADNITTEADYIPGAGPVLWAVDDGYVGQIDQKTGTFTADSHPRVFLLCQLRANGVLCVFDESYAVKRLSDQHIDEVVGLGYPLPDYAAVDKSAAELKGRLHAKGLYTRNGPATVKESIQETHRRIAPDENGVRLILVHPRCRHLQREMVSYVRDKRTGKPEKKFDHGPDALRYLAWTLRHG